jgi:DNA-binding response OmpR family regulator
LSRTLKRDGHDVLVVSPQDRPLRYVGVFRPQVIVVAASEAPQICQELRGALQHVSILAIVPGSDVRDRVAVLEAGADDCLSVPVHRAELIARVRTARRRRSALSDETGMEPVQPTARRR